MTDSFQKERERLVKTCIIPSGITDEQVLEAFRTVPRHRFVPQEYQARTYQDRPLPIGQGQTISQPSLVALMTEKLGLEGHEKVLEIGTGSGYQAAILSHLAEEVYTIERLPHLAEKAKIIFQKLGYENITVIVGDGSKGYAEAAPYEAIIVTAAAKNIPDPLKTQLAEGGRLVIPSGGKDVQLLKIGHKKEDELVFTDALPVRFVPLIGEHSWSS